MSANDDTYQSPERYVSLSPHASARRLPAPECPQSWYSALENRWESWSVGDEVDALLTVGTRNARSSRAKSRAAVEPLADADRDETEAPCGGASKLGLL